MSDEAGRVKGLDGLRAIAVLLVFLNHKFYEWHVQAMSLGGFGVRLFFVLSGFLIIGILFQQRQRIEAGKTTAGAEWRHFMINRSFRIFPIYYLLVLLILPMSALAMIPKASLEQVIYAATYTTNLWIGHILKGYPESTGHLWSLAVEEQFYLLAAPILLLIPSRLAKTVCWAGIALGIVSSVYAVMLNEWRMVYVGSLSNFAVICLGGLVALNLDKLRFPAWTGAICLVVFCLSPVAVYYVGQKVGDISNLLAYATPLLVAVTIAAVVHNQRSLMVRALDFTPVRWFGRVSYSFYLFHPFISVQNVVPGLNMVTAPIINFWLTVALSTALWIWFERPILDLKRRILHPPRSAASVAAATA